MMSYQEGENKMKEKILKKPFNVGLGLLKIWLCYEVVLTHLADYSVPQAPVLARLRDYAVPAFMLMTFFFSAQALVDSKTQWLKKRFVRLVVPFVFWSVFSFAAFRLLAPFYPALNAPWEMLGWQLLGGTTRQIGSQMWFMVVLVVLTAFFACLFRLFKSKYINQILVAVFTFAVIVEYSGLNRWVFEGLRYELCNPLGRIVSMMPYACIGIFFGLRKERLAAISLPAQWFAVGLALIWAVFMYHFKMFETPPGFFYRGFHMIAMGLAFCVAAFFLPTSMLPGKLVSAIAYISRFSMGVYFVHILVGRLFINVVGDYVGISGRCFAAANYTFVLSLIACALISLLPWKITKSLVE